MSYSSSSSYSEKIEKTGSKESSGQDDTMKNLENMIQFFENNMDFDNDVSLSKDRTEEIGGGGEHDSLVDFNAMKGARGLGSDDSDSARSVSTTGSGTLEDDEMGYELNRLSEIGKDLQDELDMANQLEAVFAGADFSSSGSTNDTTNQDDPSRGVGGVSSVPVRGGETPDWIEVEDESNVATPIHDNHGPYFSPAPPSVTSTYGYELGIRLYTNDEGYFTAPLPNSHLSNLQTTTDESMRFVLEKCHREYIRLPTSRDLRKMFFGISNNETTSVVRVATVQIRPDVTCLAVMEVVSKSIEALSGVMEDVQGEGHIYATIPIMGGENAAFYDMDCTLCTKRHSRECERVLVIRIVYPAEKQRPQKDTERPRFDVTDYDSDVEDRDEDEDVDRIREMASFLRHHLECKAVPKMKSFDGSDDYPQKEQENTTIEAPDRDDLKYPCLLATNVLAVSESWKMIRRLIREMDDEGLSFGTFSSQAFGSPPATLPTLNPHYLSQLQNLHRQEMVTSLLNTSTELEYHARSAENDCFKLSFNLIQLLRPTYNSYAHGSPPELPDHFPSMVYPLDLKQPGAYRPPWGERVKVALHKISVLNHHNNHVGPTTTFSGCSTAGYHDAKRAVDLVSSAFQRQDYEEQNRVLNKMNDKIKARMSEMLSCAHDCIREIRDLYDSNILAKRAADEVYALFSNTSVPLNSPSDQIPLLKCNILIASKDTGYSSSTGTCFVTAHQILISMKKIPLITPRYHTSHTIQIVEITTRVWEPSENCQKGRLLSLAALRHKPDGISVHPWIKKSEFGSGEEEEEEESTEILSFVPSIGAKRFKYLVDLIRSVEDPESLTYTSSDGLLDLIEN